MAKRRVVVTGLGLISPVGNSVETGWANASAGKSGIGPIGRYDVSAFSTRFAGLIKDFDITEILPPKEAKKSDPFIHYGIAASVQAIADSGFDVTDGNAHRIGVAMGSGIGGLETIEVNHDKLLSGGPRRVSPFLIPGSIINMISGHVSIMYGLTGPNIATATACTTSTHCIGLAARMIQHGDADVMLAGGAEYCTAQLGLAGFCAARALSTRNDDPERASRPWDRDRDGFVLSDGAACLALEEHEHAKARGAKIYAELVGFGMSADAYHMTAPPEDGRGAHACMRNALVDAELNPDAIDYINAHGTSTQLGDVAETVAIKRTFGEHARQLSISSTKSTTGHALGGAGALEAIFTVLALRDQRAPPTINLDNPDPDCDLDYTANVARERRIEYALSNSFGFGGTNGSVIFKRAS